ncbi:MAG: hypothetical protein EPO07_00130 [Verrucomicrobia bacterium]|nr:MAG: hypothetical protein EPO07_00130 [Verrucomicrobiota bacterium]
MSDAPPNPELLRSLGQLARGLSALFWGLPLALLLSIHATRADALGFFSIVPAIFSFGLLIYGLGIMGHFQKQERPWRLALDRARLVALVNLGLSPFLYWWGRAPEQSFFWWAVVVLAVSGGLFLLNLNLVLERLGAMLPDETLRHETRQFTALNRGLLIALGFLAAVFLFLTRMPNMPLSVVPLLMVLERSSLWLLVFMVLLPLALTMALIWKTKEVILESVFGSHH